MPKHYSSICGSIYNGEKVLKECYGGLRNEEKYETKSPNTLAYLLGALARQKKFKKNTWWSQKCK
jgi:hypothetical protein